MKTQTRKVTARSTCDSFTVEVTAKISTKNLTIHETNEVKRKLKHKLSDAMSSLPFGDVYPHEVVMR